MAFPFFSRATPASAGFDAILRRFHRGSMWLLSRFF